MLFVGVPFQEKDLKNDTFITRAFLASNNYVHVLSKFENNGSFTLTTRIYKINDKIEVMEIVEHVSFCSLKIIATFVLIKHDKYCAALSLTHDVHLFDDFFLNLIQTTIKTKNDKLLFVESEYFKKEKNTDNQIYSQNYHKDMTFQKLNIDDIKVFVLNDYIGDLFNLNNKHCKYFASQMKQYFADSFEENKTCCYSFNDFLNVSNKIDSFFEMIYCENKNYIIERKKDRLIELIKNL